MIDHEQASWPELWLTVTAVVRHGNLPTPMALILINPESTGDGPLATMELASNEDARRWMRYADPSVPEEIIEGRVYGHCKWMGWTIITKSRNPA
jgi:hypothetical protein